MNKAEVFIKLLEKAGHPNTPAEEAKACAIQARIIFSKYQLVITELECEEIPNEIPEQMFRQEKFQVTISNSTGLCINCKQSYNRGVVVTKKNNQTAHYKCRHFWSQV